MNIGTSTAPYSSSFTPKTPFFGFLRRNTVTITSGYPSSVAWGDGDTTTFRTIENEDTGIFISAFSRSVGDLLDPASKLYRELRYSKKSGFPSNIDLYHGITFDNFGAATGIKSAIRYAEEHSTSTQAANFDACWQQYLDYVERMSTPGTQEAQKYQQHEGTSEPYQHSTECDPELEQWLRAYIAAQSKWLQYLEEQEAAIQGVLRTIRDNDLSFSQEPLQDTVTRVCEIIDNHPTMGPEIKRAMMRRVQSTLQNLSDIPAKDRRKRI